jgi:hypothetical protein
LSLDPAGLMIVGESAPNRTANFAVRTTVYSRTNRIRRIVIALDHIIDGDQRTLV